MRSSTFYSFAFTASALLVQGIPLGERDAADDNVVTEVRTVTVGDGSFQAGAGNVVGTSTVYDSSETPVPAAGAVVEDMENTENTDDMDDVDGTEGTENNPAKKRAAAPRPQNVVYVTQTMGSIPEASPAPSNQQNTQPGNGPANGSGANTQGQTESNVESDAGSAPESKPKPSTGGSKRGLSYEPQDVSLLKAFAGSKASWVYNWGASTKDGVPSGMEFVPMLWGNDPAKYTNSWPEQAKKAIASGSKHLLSYNEPDHKEQANLDPKTAADGHIKFMNPLGTGDVKIGGPAVTNGEAEKGMGPTGWLKPFLEKCSGKCKIDFQPVHWYDSYDNMAYFKKFLKETHDVAKKPLWLTEFAASGSPEQQAKFLAEALPYLDGLDYVERYAYFMVKDGKMMSGGAPNAVGKAYVQ